MTSPTTPEPPITLRSLLHRGARIAFDAGVEAIESKARDVRDRLDRAIGPAPETEYWIERCFDTDRRLQKAEAALREERERKCGEPTYDTAKLKAEIARLEADNRKTDAYARKLEVTNARLEGEVREQAANTKTIREQLTALRADIHGLMDRAGIPSDASAQKRVQALVDQWFELTNRP